MNAIELAHVCVSLIVTDELNCVKCLKDPTKTPSHFSLKFSSLCCQIQFDL